MFIDSPYRMIVVETLHDIKPYLVNHVVSVLRYLYEGEWWEKGFIIIIPDTIKKQYLLIKDDQERKSGISIHDCCQVIIENREIFLDPPIIDGNKLPSIDMGLVFELRKIRNECAQPSMDKPDISVEKAIECLTTIAHFINPIDYDLSTKICETIQIIQNNNR